MFSYAYRHRVAVLLAAAGWIFAATGACSKEEPGKPEPSPPSETRPAPETEADTGVPPDEAVTETSPAAETQPAEEPEPGAETQPASETQPSAETQPESETKPGDEGEPEKKEEPKEIPLSFTDAKMDQIAKFVSDHMGKPVLIDDEVKEKKLSVTNPKPIPVDEALHILRTAMHEQGVAIEERDKTIHIIPISKVRTIRLDTIGPDVDIATIEPTNDIVRKVFVIERYDPAKMADILKPLVPEWGLMTADPITRRLVVIAEVERLVTMSRIIKEYDSEAVAGGELRSFEIRNVDVYEIIPTLQKLIANYLGVEVKTTGSGSSARPDRHGPPGSDRPGEDSSGSGSIIIKADQTPVLLIPEPRRSMIVVAAPVNVLDQIERWLVTLDQPKPRSSEWEFVEVKYGDANDLADQLTKLLSQIPDEALRSALRVVPFASSRRLMIVGSEQNRTLIKEWLTEIDVEDAGVRITKTFKLQYADAQQVAESIKELFEDSSRRRYYWYDDYNRGGSDRDKVTVTANMRQNTVTVVAAPEKMNRIAEQIENEWDVRLEDDVAPLIVTLKYADPETTKELLENLFTKKERSGGWRDWYYGGSEETVSPVGRLFGQFTFQAYPETGKLIVVSKNAENYEYIKDLIAKIDSPQEAGLPKTIQLKFADAETVAEQINALLNAPGTPTSILRRGRVKGFELFADDLSPFSKAANTQQNRPNQGGGEQDQSKGKMDFWWQQPPSRDIKARQPSNLVGKLRIVPNIERNMLLVAVPEEYADAVEELVRELDQPSYQVLIKAVVAEATLDDAMSLGFRFSTDRSQFTSGDPLITENALHGLFTYAFEDVHANTHTFSFDADVNNLLSLLGKETEITIKSEPKILTADNVEGEFFDGQDIPFISDSTLSEVGDRTSFDYIPVGIRLRVRPHITEDQTVNLTVQLTVSSVIPGRTLFGGAIVDRRETFTQITLEHGRTFMISGILRDKQNEIIRRVPGLGDIPLMGELFKHRETQTINTEVLVFLTPYIIAPYAIDPDRTPIEDEPMRQFERSWPGPEQFGEVPEAPDDPVEEVSSAGGARIGQGG